jgi:hypothetical protein
MIAMTRLGVAMVLLEIKSDFYILSWHGSVCDFAIVGRTWFVSPADRERLMLKYYMWAVGEKALSYVPCSRPLYNGLGYLTTRTSKRRLVGCGTSYHLIRKARELTPAGGTILDFGTAWHHHDAFLLYLIGDYKIYLFDIQDRAWLSYIKTYL